MTTLQNKLAKIRGRIEELTDEREEIAAAPIPRDEAAARIAGVIAAPFNDQILSPEPAGLLDGSFGEAGLKEMLSRPALLVAAFPAQITKYLLEVYDRQRGDATPGLSAGERRKSLVEIAARIFELEAEEELVIERMEAEGTFILRRAEANPVAQLGLDPDAGEAA